jgi:hypothetical protein
VLALRGDPQPAGAQGRSEVRHRGIGPLSGHYRQSR